MGDQAQLSGPDLTNGVPSGSIPDGALFLGHAGGEAVMLTRVDGECTAA